VFLLHEVHHVAGKQEDAFDAAYRDELIPALATTDDTRLLWFLRLAHGGGHSYTIVTITGCKDANVWATLAERIRHGDLADWSARTDALRHNRGPGAQTKILTPVPWSPLQEIDFASVPTDSAEHEATLFMEDTAWPYSGGLQAYLAKAGTLYDRTLAESKGSAHSIIELEAAFQPVHGTHTTTEVVLWQRVVNNKALSALLAHELTPASKAPGTWMHDALEVRDQWESRILRAVPWSPLY
jgi:hypothetical protein